MAALEDLKAMLNRAGIDYRMVQSSEHGPGYTEEVPENGWRLELKEGDKGVLGYHRFLTAFYFDDKGNLLKIGAWE